MIRIKEKVEKKTKAHISFEFSHSGKVIQSKLTIPLKLYKTLSEQEVFMHVRGQVLKKRIKLGDKVNAKDPFFKAAGTGKAREEGTSGSDHDEVLYSAEAHGIEDKEE